MKSRVNVFITIMAGLIVLWLLWPLTQIQSGPVGFGRITVGIMLVVIFVGKLFYDSIIDGFRRSGQNKKHDFVSLLFLVTVIALAIAVIIAMIGVLLFKLLSQNTPI